MFKLTRTEQIIIAVVFVVIVCLGYGIYVFEHRAERRAVELTPGDEKVEPDQPAGGESAGKLTVHISGEVELPGVYSFPVGTRIYQALAKAKVKSSGYVGHLNQAEPLFDGQKLDIPGQAQDKKNGSLNHSALKRIDLNTASFEELQTLPGIGPVYALRIIQYRREQAFKRIEEITNIKGIGLKTFADLRDKICVQ